MITNVLSQGLTPQIENSVGSILVKFLNSDEYHSFTAISAFASQAGVNGLSEHIENAKHSTFTNLNIIVGVNQKSTTKEALEMLMELGLNQALIFYQPGYPIFHPKIYLFEGEHRSQLIVGSSNLTAQGLFANVEASIHLDLDNSKEDDRQVITDLKALFAGIFDFTHPNLQPITADLIEKFVAEKIVPTEAESRAIQVKIKELDVAPAAPLPKVIQTIFKPRPLPRAPKAFRGKKVGAATPVQVDVIMLPEEGVPGPADEEFTLVWRRRKLPASSVEIAGTENTNITGGLRLVQDKFDVDGSVINQTTYFRQTVFGELAWEVEKTTPIVEKATGRFHLSILGEYIGLVPLVIRHKPSGEAGQHNYTTSISWGALSKNIRDRVLTGKRLNLHRSETDYDIFKLEIV